MQRRFPLPHYEITKLAVCVLAVFLLVLCAVSCLCNVQIVGTLLAPLVAGASRPPGSLREPSRRLSACVSPAYYQLHIGRVTPCASPVCAIDQSPPPRVKLCN